MYHTLSEESSKIFGLTQPFGSTSVRL